ncbi:unnamed protein product [Spodoptera exigua]|nr:unnamed protein product [Spodoptera exigua]
MRTVTLLALFLLGVNALPEFDTQLANERQARLVTGQIIEGIEEISQAIRDMGLDPISIEKETLEYELPVPVIFNAAAEVEDFRSFGISDIVVERMDLSIIFSRVDFHIVLPHIHFFARKAKGEVTLFGEKLTAEGDGNLDIRNIDVVGRVNYRLRPISGVTLTNLDIDFKIGQIRSFIRLAIQGQNYSPQITNFINNQIPATLDEFSAEINELLEIVLLDMINENL